jgi:hypothetical protein
MENAFELHFTYIQRGYVPWEHRQISYLSVLNFSTRVKPADGNSSHCVSYFAASSGKMVANGGAHHPLRTTEKKKKQREYDQTNEMARRSLPTGSSGNLLL